MRNLINIVVVDDHPLMLKSLVSELTQYNYKVIGRADNGAKALELITTLNPDIALLDIELPLLNAYEIAKKAKQTNIKTKFIFITYHKENGFMVQAKRLNIEGYLTKDDAFTTIDKCILTVFNGDTFYSPFEEQENKNNIHFELKIINQLSPTERTIIRLIANKNTSQDIANKLSISIRTVQKHRTNIIKKLNISGTSNPIESWIFEHQEVIKTL